MAQFKQNAGKISHEQAVEKATDEYVKYQQKTLSDVEKSYLESLKLLEDVSSSKIKGRKKKD